MKKLPYRIYLTEEDMTEIKVLAVRSHMPLGDYIVRTILGREAIKEKPLKEDKA